MPKFAYWSVADGNHAKMMATCIASARLAGVQEEFHIWSDQEIPGAITQGETLDEARENLADALRMVLECNRELARETESANAVREPIELVSL